MYEKGSYPNVEPNFCYDNIGSGGDDVRVLPLSNIRNTLLNSGFQIQEIDKLRKMKQKNLTAFMEQLFVSRAKSGERHPVVIHPPY